MASWLVHPSSDRAVWVRALAEDIVLCSWARHFTLTVPLSTQMYICGSWRTYVMLGVTLPWTSIPSRERRNTPKSLHATNTGISSGLIGHLAHMQTFPYFMYLLILLAGYWLFMFTSSLLGGTRYGPRYVLFILISSIKDNILG